ncbi:MAG: DUF4115 domain-containing protein [Candidatus Omnitrophica bacterium]|jgi:transcriptional regulator with XRE-family HTH domain|nr:DUF4115 domain-containing protein [Candidatus Omnitrophota bacterium]
MDNQGIGNRLKEIRLSKGLTLEDVHKKTKIHLNILRSIEEDNFVSVDPIYLKGFLKIYAQSLGQDYKEFVPESKIVAGKMHVQEEHQQNIKAHIPQKKSSFNLLKSPVIVFVRRNARNFVFILVIVLVVFIAARLIKKASYFLRSKAVSHSRQFAPKQRNSPASVRSAPAPIVIDDLIRLSIRARENCYIKLRSDGKVMFQSILKKGRFETWVAKEKIEFSLSDASCVDIEINGKMISSLGRKNQAVNNILVTKQGLQIK